jgi:hypothetical protein
MRTLIVEKMDMNPQKGIDEDFQLWRGKHVHEYFVSRIRHCRLQ